MKRILFLVLFMSGLSYCQLDTNKTYLSKEDRKNIDEAGWALKQYTTWHYIGTAGAITGGSVIIIGSLLKDEQTKEGVIYAGVGISLVGFLIQSFSPGFIAKAGNFLIKIGGQ